MAKGLISSGLERVYPSKVPPATPRAARHAPGDYGVTADPDWRATDWSEHLRSIRLAGRSVTYVEIGSGEGPPVVLVHGLGANWENWLETLPALALDAVLLYDFRDRLEEISCPALLLWGEKDMLVPVADADEFERRIPDARKVLLEDTGHAPQLERPTEFNRELFAFLAEGTGQGGRIDARSPSAEASSNGAGPERSGVRAA